MALIKCPECGKEISDTTSKCIHCGYEFSKEKVDTSDKEIIILRRNRSVSYAESIICGVLAVLFFFSGLRCFLTSILFGCFFAWDFCIAFIVGSFYSLCLVSSNNSCKSEVLTKKDGVYYAYRRSGERTVLTREQLKFIKCKKNTAIDKHTLGNKKILGYIYPEDINKFDEELLTQK